MLFLWSKSSCLAQCLPILFRLKLKFLYWQKALQTHIDTSTFLSDVLSSFRAVFLHHFCTVLWPSTLLLYGLRHCCFFVLDFCPSGEKSSHKTISLIFRPLHCTVVSSSVRSSRAFYLNHNSPHYPSVLKFFSLPSCIIFTHVFCLCFIPSLERRFCEGKDFCPFCFPYCLPAPSTGLLSGTQEIFVETINKLYHKSYYNMFIFKWNKE